LLGDFEGGVEVGEFVGHSELAFFEGVGHVFAGLADEGEFEVVDGGGAVSGDEGDEVSFEEFDEQGAEAVLDEVGAGEEDDGFFLLASFDDIFGEGGEQFNGGGGEVEIDVGEVGASVEVLQFDLVASSAERVGADSGGVEYFVFAVIFHLFPPSGVRLHGKVVPCI